MTVPRAGAGRNASFRSRAGRPRYPLHRHQPRWRPSEDALSRRVLPARQHGKPHQILEDASCGRPHVLLQGSRQPVPAVPACRSLLADVGLAQCHAQALGLAGAAVRYSAAAACQNRRARGGVEDANPAASAVRLSASNGPSNPPWQSAALRHLNGGAPMPPDEPLPLNRKLRLPPLISKRRAAPCPKSGNWDRWASFYANSEALCIIRARRVSLALYH